MIRAGRFVTGTNVPVSPDPDPFQGTDFPAYGQIYGWFLGLDSDCSRLTEASNYNRLVYSYRRRLLGLEFRASQACAH